MDFTLKNKQELLDEIDRLQTQNAELSGKLKQAGAEITNLQAKYRQLTENMNDVIWEVSLDLTIKYISSGIERLTGFRPDEMIGKNLFDFFEPDVAEKLKYTFRSRMESYSLTSELKSGIFEHLQLCKNGSYKWFEALSNPIFDSDNKLIGFQGISRDISDWKTTNDALKISEEKLSKVFHSAPFVITILRISDQQLIEVNEIALEILGYTREEILQDKSLALNIWANPDDRLSYYESIKNQTTLKHFELQFRTKSGEIGTALMSTEYITIGEELCVIGFFEVVSDKRKAIEALRQSEANLSALIENTIDNIWVVDTQYQLVLVNGSFKKQFQLNYGIELIQGINMLDTLPEAEAKIWKERYDRALANEHFQFVEHFDFGTTEFYVELSMNPILIDQVIIGVSVFARDITARKLSERLVVQKNKEIEAQNQELRLAEEKLRLSEATYRGILDSISEAIYIQDLQGHFLEVNQRAVEMYGYPKEFFFGKTPEFLSAPEMNKSVDLKKINRKTVEGKPQTFQFWGIRKNGSTFPKEVSLTLGSYFDQKAIIAVSRDISERKEAEIILQKKNEEIAAQNEEYLQLNEELLQMNQDLIKARDKAEESDRLKTAFLQNMSHEIRTPMNAIMGFSSLLSAQYNNKEKLEQYAQIINSRCTDLLDIINDILDIAKIESAQVTINHEECDLNMLFLELEAFYNEHRKRIAKSHIHLKMNAAVEQDEYLVLTDKGKLKQILINLTSNAFKFTESGAIEAGCTLESDYLKFYVADTGIGIPKEKFESVFERFVQLNQQNNKVYGGTGLGLSIVKGLVNLLGGKIWIESEIGRGTTFFFSIPFRKAKPTIDGHDEEDGFDRFNFKNFKLLIVEDDQFNAEYLFEVLEPYQFEIIHTAFGKDAIQIATNQKIDLVLMDIRLPDMDGYEATRLIKKQKPELIIIAQTAYAASGDEKKALQTGCEAYISKPIKQSQLLNLLQKFLHAK